MGKQIVINAIFTLFLFVTGLFVKLLSRQLRGKNGILLLAIQILHEVCEMYLCSLFMDSNLAAIHAGRVMVKPSDIQLVRHIRGDTT